ncbi:DUF3889 domain-containing protein [Brevibacillus sp. B_LB10_24]|uniref:DUF3889 domain-containing protein n=1 Tax=Brevibacillus sp. B_LB10_24 TaxID=3380645 RepID=UPI0038BCA984
MKRVWTSLIALFFIFAAAANAAPEHAKWGTIAVKEAQKRFEADIIDYKYLGRSEITSTRSEAKFRLWLRDRVGNEFGVYVFILFDPAAEKAVAIRFVKD